MGHIRKWLLKKTVPFFCSFRANEPNANLRSMKICQEIELIHCKKRDYFLFITLFFYCHMELPVIIRLSERQFSRLVSYYLQSVNCYL